MELNEKTARSFQQFPYGYVVLGLCIAVVTLFGLYYNMSQFIIKDLMENSNKMQVVIEKNSEILQLFRK